MEERGEAWNCGRKSSQPKAQNCSWNPETHAGWLFYLGSLQKLDNRCNTQSHTDQPSQILKVLSSIRLLYTGDKCVKKREVGRRSPELKAAALDLRPGRAVQPLTTICWLPQQDGHPLNWCYCYSRRLTWTRRPGSWTHWRPFEAMKSSTWWAGGGGSGLSPVTASNQPSMGFSPEKPGLQAWDASSEFLRVPALGGAWVCESVKPPVAGEADVDYASPGFWGI